MKVILFFVLVIFFAVCKAEDIRLHPVCMEPQPTGPCDTGYKMRRVYYDAAEKKCKQFSFEGCNHSRNLFVSLKSCQSFCEKKPEELCRLPLKLASDSGKSCIAMLNRFYYKASEKKCVKFQYGGCFGNQNNFYSAKECEEFCANV